MQVDILGIHKEVGPGTPRGRQGLVEEDELQGLAGWVGRAVDIEMELMTQ